MPGGDSGRIGARGDRGNEMYVYTGDGIGVGFVLGEGGCNDNDESRTLSRRANKRHAAIDGARTRRDTSAAERTDGRMRVSN